MQLRYIVYSLYNYVVDILSLESVFIYRSQLNLPGWQVLRLLPRLATIRLYIYGVINTQCSHKYFHTGVYTQDCHDHDVYSARESILQANLQYVCNSGDECLPGNSHA